MSEITIILTGIVMLVRPPAPAVNPVLYMVDAHAPRAAKNPGLPIIPGHWRYILYREADVERKSGAPPVDLQFNVGHELWDLTLFEDPNTGSPRSSTFTLDADVSTAPVFNDTGTTPPPLPTNPMRLPLKDVPNIRTEICAPLGANCRLASPAQLIKVIIPSGTFSAGASPSTVSAFPGTGISRPLPQQILVDISGAPSNRLTISGDTGTFLVLNSGAAPLVAEIGNVPPGDLFGMGGHMSVDSHFELHYDALTGAPAVPPIPHDVTAAAKPSVTVGIMRLTGANCPPTQY